MAGPLHGLKIVEMAGLGPAPFAAMLLADMGAEMIRIERPGTRAFASEPRFDVMGRNRRSAQPDLRTPDAVQALLELVERSDVLIEGFRPGVMERLGLGPDVCLRRQPRLVYGRMTGWGQSGPLSHSPGHDINYIAISGALNAIGRSDEAPAIPLNYIGDFGGGGMLLAFGVMCAVFETRQSGQGQVVDAAMIDGAALLSAMIYGMKADGRWSSSRGANILDGAAHFYATYACADGKCIAVGAIEPQFYAVLRERAGIEDPLFERQHDRELWPLLKSRLAELFKTRTRDGWAAIFEGSDACVAPVLDWEEAPLHPQNQSRETFVDIDGVTQPAPAPRFSRTPASRPGAGDDVAKLLENWGIDPDTASRLTKGSSS